MNISKTNLSCHSEILVDDFLIFSAHKNMHGEPVEKLEIFFPDQNVSTVAYGKINSGLWPISGNSDFLFWPEFLLYTSFSCIIR